MKLTRPWKITAATLTVVLALVVGWFLTQPSGTGPAAPPAPAPVPATATGAELFTAPDNATVTKAAPVDVRWQLADTIAAPSSRTGGPSRVSPEGIGSGYAHTPTGALLAAANWSADLARTVPNPALYPPLVQQRMAPWPGQDAALRRAQAIAKDPGERHAIFQLVGFRFLAYDTTHATLLIAKQVVVARQAYADYVNLVWLDGDWRVIPAIDGYGELGSPVTLPLLPEWTPFAGVA